MRCVLLVQGPPAAAAAVLRRRVVIRVGAELLLSAQVALRFRALEYASWRAPWPQAPPGTEPRPG